MTSSLIKAMSLWLKVISELKSVKEHNVADASRWSMFICKQDLLHFPLLYCRSALILRLLCSLKCGIVTACFFTSISRSSTFIVVDSFASDLLNRAATKITSEAAEGCLAWMFIELVKSTGHFVEWLKEVYIDMYIYWWFIWCHVHLLVLIHIKY